IDLPCVEWLMPVQSGEITNILLLLQGQHQCVLVALAKTVSQFTHNCTHIHLAPAHRVSYLHSLVLPCEAGTNFTYKVLLGYDIERKTEKTPHFTSIKQ